MLMARTQQNNIGIVFLCHCTMIRWVSIKLIFSHKTHKTHYNVSTYTFRTWMMKINTAHRRRMKNNLNSNQSSMIIITVWFVYIKTHTHTHTQINKSQIRIKIRLFTISKNCDKHEHSLDSKQKKLSISTNLNEMWGKFDFVISGTDIIIVMDVHRYRNRNYFRLFCFVSFLFFSLVHCKIKLLSV